MRLFFWVFIFSLTMPVSAHADLMAEFGTFDYRDTAKLREMVDRFAKDIGQQPEKAPTEMLLAATDMASCLWNVVPTDADQKKYAELGYRWAKELYRRDPNDTAALYFMALNLLLYAQTKGVLDTLFSLREVREYAEKAYQKNPKFLYSSPRILLGALYLFAPGFPISFGDVDIAEKYLLEAVKNEPRQTTPHVLLGAVYAKKGDIAKSIQSFERVRGVAPWTRVTGVYEKDMDFWWYVDQIRALQARSQYDKGEKPRVIFDSVDHAVRKIKEPLLPKALESALKP